MPGKLTIEFEDGEKEEIVIAKMIARSAKDEGKSIDFMENKNGKWIMTYSPSIADNGRLSSINCVKTYDPNTSALKAKLTINFEDSSKEEMILDHAIVLDLNERQPNSLTFRQLTDGLWIMNFTAKLWKDRKFKNVHCSKET